MLCYYGTGFLFELAQTYNLRNSTSVFTYTSTPKMSTAPADLTFFLITCGISAFANICQDALIRVQTISRETSIPVINQVLHLDTIDRGTPVTTASPATVPKPPIAPSTTDSSPVSGSAFLPDHYDSSLGCFFLAMLLIMALSSAAFIRLMGFRGLAEEASHEVVPEHGITDDSSYLEGRARRQTMPNSLVDNVPPQALNFSSITAIDTKPTAHQDKVRYSFSDIVSTELSPSQPQSALPQSLEFSSIAAIDTKPIPPPDEMPYSFSDIVSTELSPISPHAKSPAELAFSELSTTIDFDNEPSTNESNFGQTNIEQGSPSKEAPSPPILTGGQYFQGSSESTDHPTMRIARNTANLELAEPIAAMEINPSDQVLGPDVEIAGAHPDVSPESMERQVAQAEAKMSDSSNDVPLDDESPGDVPLRSSMEEVQAEQPGKNTSETSSLTAEEARSRFKTRVAYPLSPITATREQGPDGEGWGPMSISNSQSNEEAPKEPQHDGEQPHRRGERWWMGKALAQRLAAIEDDTKRAEFQAKADAKRQAEKLKPRNIRRHQELHEKQKAKQKEKRNEKKMAVQEAEKESSEK